MKELKNWAIFLVSLIFIAGLVTLFVEFSTTSENQTLKVALPILLGIIGFIVIFAALRGAL
jgi:uncharacterized membrane protein